MSMKSNSRIRSDDIGQLCYSHLVGILSTKYPDEVMDLVAYQITIIEAQRTFMRDGWIHALNKKQPTSCWIRDNYILCWYEETLLAEQT